MKYKDLKPWGKVEYIWNYYKFPILATSFCLIMIIWIFTTVWTNKHRVIALDVTILGSQVDFKVAEQLEVTLQKAFTDMGIEGEVLVDLINLSNAGSPDEQLANNARFFSKTSTNTVDVIISLGDDYTANAEAGMFAPLDELFENGTLKVEDNDKIYNTQNEATNEKIYGIDVALNPVLAGLTDPANGLILSMYTNSEKKENAIELFKYILQ